MILPTTSVEVAPTDTQIKNDIQTKGKTHVSMQDVLLVPIGERWQHGLIMYAAPRFCTPCGWACVLSESNTAVSVASID
jgi:hypothetical protein